MRCYNWNKIRLQCGRISSPRVYLKRVFARKYRAWWFNAENENAVFFKFTHRVAVCSSVAILPTKEKAAILDMSHCLLLPPAGVYTQLCIQRWVARLWKLLPPPQKCESIPPYKLTLTTTKSPVIPDTLLGCQSHWICQNNCLTTGFCEAEDKAEPLNKNQIHNPHCLHTSCILSISPTFQAHPNTGSYPSNHLQYRYQDQYPLFFFFLLFHYLFKNN